MKYLDAFSYPLLFKTKERQLVLTEHLLHAMLNVLNSDHIKQGRLELV